MDNLGFPTVEEGIEAAMAAKADIVVLCSSDDEYAEYAVPAFKALNGRAMFIVIAQHPETFLFRLPVAQFLADFSLDRPPAGRFMEILQTSKHFTEERKIMRKERNTENSLIFAYLEPATASCTACASRAAQSCILALITFLAWVRSGYGIYCSG